MTPEPLAALDFTVRVVAVGSLIAATEMLAGRRHFGTGGVFARGAVAPFKDRTGPLDRFDRFTVPLVTALAVCSAALAALGPASGAGRAALAATLVVHLAVRWRRHLGGDGAEQLTTLVLGAAALAVLPAPSPGRVMLAVTFIGAQVTLSYFTAGLAKLVSPTWRNGSALPAILSTRGHGHPWAAALLGRAGGLGWLGCWVVISFECLFPAMLAAPEPVALTTLAIGLGFHLSCALLMGLNSFLWTFPATYPCVLAALRWLGAAG